MTAFAPEKPLIIPTAAARQLLTDLYGPCRICVTCGGTQKRGRNCQACAIRAGTPARPCSHCGDLAAKLTGGYCGTCYKEASRLEDYEFCLAAGDIPEVAAERAGVSLGTIRRYQDKWRTL